jgi:hypothetical protein
MEGELGIDDANGLLDGSVDDMLDGLGLSDVDAELAALDRSTHASRLSPEAAGLSPSAVAPEPRAVAAVAAPGDSVPALPIGRTDYEDDLDLYDDEPLDDAALDELLASDADDTPSHIDLQASGITASADTDALRTLPSEDIGLDTRMEIERGALLGIGSSITSAGVELPVVDASAFDFDSPRSGGAETSDVALLPATAAKSTLGQGAPEGASGQTDMYGDDFGVADGDLDDLDDMLSDIDFSDAF